MHRRSNRVGPRTTVAGWLMVGCVSVSGWAQQAATPQAATKQQPLTRPPSLTVDRDPVASPDGEGPVKPGVEGPQVGADANIEKQGSKYTLREDAFEVRLNATVLDGSGKSVQTLDKDAFHVYEDGVQQTINSFRHEDLPVSLGLLIDSSGSMYDKRIAVDKASVDFVKLSNPADEEFLVDFSWEAYIDQDFTNSVDKLQQGLGYIKSSGGTAIYDALVASADYLSKNAKHPKQVLLLVTDGEDNASSATLEQTIRRIQDLDGPVIYCVGLLFGDDTDKRESRHARKVLETLAEQTGGAAYFPKNINQVDEIAAEVAQDIRTQYTISYHSTKSPTLGGYREVHVEAKSKNFGRLSVRTRTGYFPKVGSSDSKAGNVGQGSTSDKVASKH
jgi:Ca-activated chloride channel family protein